MKVTIIINKVIKANIGLIKYIAPINKNAKGTSRNIDKLDGEYTFFSTSDIPKYVLKLLGSVLYMGKYCALVMLS